MSDALQVHVILPPIGHVFALICRCRGVPFREGFFRQLAVARGEAWAVGFHVRMDECGDNWRVINTAANHEVTLCRAKVPL